MKWRMGEAPYMATRSQRVSSHHAESMISMDGPGALCNNGHPSRGHYGRLNGAQAGGYCAMFRPISLLLAFCSLAVEVGVTRPQ